MCIFVIDEYALRRTIGGPQVMLDQLTQLRDLAQRPNIVVKIVPSGTEYFAACPFMIVRFDGTEIANLDTALDGLIIEDPQRATEITKIWEDIRESALPPKDSAVLIERVIEEWTP